MDLNKFLEILNNGNEVIANSEVHKYMSYLADEAMKLSNELNNGYNPPEKVQELFFRLINKPIDRTFRLFPPFYTDCGKNISIGKNVFINSCCHFQDQGGITIGNNVLIGHNVVIATLNHNPNPKLRASAIPPFSFSYAETKLYFWAIWLHAKPLSSGEPSSIKSNSTLIPQSAA